MAYIDKYGVEYSDDKKTLVRCPKDYQGEFIVPEGVVEICGKSLIGAFLNGGFSGCTGITSIAIPQSVSKIGACAFCGCLGLNHPIYHDKKLVFVPRDYKGTFVVEEGTEEILGGAFCKCIEIDSIKLPVSLKMIGEKAFNRCINLSSINIPDSVQRVDGSAFENCTNFPIIDGVRYADTCLVEIVDKEKETYVIKYNTRWVGENAFKGCERMKSIEIPNNVKGIGRWAFRGCKNLISVEIPNSLKEVGALVFEGCDGLNNPLFNDSVFVYLPTSYVGGFKILDGITKIAGGAFMKCIGLTSLDIPNSVKEIGIWAFSGCTGLTSVEIPNSVTEIGIWAFSGCTGLTSVEIPNSVTEIADSAFHGCTGLTSIEIPNSVTKIGNSAFYDCTGLTSVEIPSSVTKIGRESFYGCTGLTSIDIPNSVTEIADSAFHGCTGLTSIEIPNSVTKIGNSAFYDCTGLTSVEIPSSVTKIGRGSFYGCTGLTSIEIPNSVMRIGNDAFRGCTGLISIEISNSITEIGDSAFWGCTGLTSVEIPNGVTKIGKTTFYGCTGLTSIDIPNSVMIIGDCAFCGCSNLNLVDLPNSVSMIGDAVFGDCTNLKNVIIANRTLVFVPTSFQGEYVISNDINYIAGEAFSECSKITAIKIPNSVTRIGNGAFSDCIGLTSIEIPESVQEIGHSAFSGCTSLFSIDIPSSVTMLGDCVLDNCRSLKSIEIPNSITDIKDFTFDGCLELTCIEIPNSVRRIGFKAFNSCQKLQLVEIPNSVAEIGAEAFNNIGPHLEVVVDDANEHYCDQNGSLFSKDMSVMFHCCEKGIDEYLVPHSVKRIATCAFEWSKLKKLIIQEGVEELESDAFWCMSIQVVYLPKYIKKIGKTCFKKSKTNIIHIAHEHPEQIEVAEDAFDECAANCTLYVPIGTGYAYRHHPVFGKFKEVVIEKNTNPKTTESMHIEDAISTGKQKDSSISNVAQSEAETSIVSQSPVRTMVFFDTETTGVPRDYQAPVSDSANWPRLVQLAWIVWDATNNKQLKEKSVIISPNGFVIPSEASSVHGITTERARREGINLHSALDEFMTDVQNASCVIGHNVDFDRHIVGAELYRMGKNTGTLMDLPFTCTMQSSIEFCQLPPYRYGHYKWPKLDELHNKLFGRSFADAHDAMADIRATKDCYFELVKRGVIKES